ncbi:uncharacterized protein B0T23DRAFT_395844 [Neurospora hispaniola]|uniref:Uncharacterized protein n=1 Tax=Neurospora hispaniola TaxID=588809 RepID=A0AAJ0I7P0_9PEZI|nr:hypothetical protein B0T23DRAFT_395844 [Neurospora hispaniola]
MENPIDSQDVSQKDLFPVSEETLVSLLVDPETRRFHSWLFDILMDFFFEENEIQGDPREELLETLVSRCHDANGMSQETREFRKNVLKILIQEGLCKPHATLSGRGADMENSIPSSEVLQELKDELDDKRREERLKRKREEDESQKLFWLKLGTRRPLRPQ